MNKGIKIALISVGVCLLGAGTVLFVKNSLSSKRIQVVVQNETQEVIQKERQDFAATDQSSPTMKPEDSAASAAPMSAVLGVPFIIQAPFANWDDPVFQNACEEASMVMAINWAAGVHAISPQNAQQQILDIVSFENKTFGYNADTDGADVVRIFKEYLNYQHVNMQENVSIDDIRNELEKGNIVLVPAFGQALENPNYTAPGPIAHMLVITGYDQAAKEFITNDPGTRRGQNYRYDASVLFGAIWEYSSGDGPLQPPLKGEMKKTMIVVRPQG